MTTIQIPLMCNVSRKLLRSLVHQIITINVDAIAHTSIATLAKIDEDDMAHISTETLAKIDEEGSLSTDLCECFSITMNTGEKFYCAVNIFLKHQNEILKSIKTTNIRDVDIAGVRSLFDIEALRKTV